MKTKWIKRILIICTVAVCIAGCGKKDNKEQDALRTYGINCLASGDYEEAIEAFQGALDQNVGLNHLHLFLLLLLHLKYP